MRKCKFPITSSRRARKHDRPSGRRLRARGCTLSPTGKEITLANNSKEARDKAEANAKKQEQRAREGAKAMADYEAEGRAVRERTAKLKSLRLAKEAAEKEAGPKPVTSKKKASP